ncbi:flagellar basal body P-ring protein FlgI [Thalassoglobus sp.]|uniref:flagellar basal body P-ring protein FlgI n=1 Tax=Thalassoglobus sp. TaxID=2795869 RepID=UPI003AA8A6A5
MQAKRPASKNHDDSKVNSQDASQSRRAFLKATAASFALGSVFSGCHELNLRKWFDKDEVMRQKVRSAIRGEEGHSRLIGDYIKIAESTLGYIKVQGVGFVHSLEGTGEDPPASPLRKRLLDDLRLEQIKDPNTMLRSPDTCLVVVTAYIPPIVRKGDKMDIEVTLPDGSQAKSLAGGWLMPCLLSEHALLEGQVREGSNIGIAVGPILVNSLTSTDSKSTTGLKRGVIPGGGRYTGDDRVLTVAIRNDYRTVRMSTTIADRIGHRFYDYDRSGIQRKLCEAKSNAHLELIVHERYRDNYPRYLQCIRHMALTETPVEKHMRMQQLEDAIQFGPTSQKAALQLEATGPDGIPILKIGLASKSPEARFRAAEALAYLGNGDGVAILKESAAQEPAFRIFALAALAALPNSDSAEALRELMDHESLETRYGAFRALSTMSPNDPNLNRIDMKGDYSLHLIDSETEPFIHITRNKKAEVVLFNQNQKFQLPMFVRASSKILVQGNPSANGIVIKRIAAGEETQTLEVSARVVDVIKGATELGATYADIVQMLVQAEQQHNLPGEIAIDKLPKPGRVYHRIPEDMGNNSSGDSSTVPIGNDGLMPNLFEELPNKPILPTSTLPTGKADKAAAGGPNSFEVL